jgi:hypothetical protein
MVCWHAMNGRDDPSDDPAGATLVDESLIDATLALSPEERLRQNDRMLRTIRLLRESVVAATSDPDGQRR